MSSMLQLDQFSVSVEGRQIGGDKAGGGHCGPLELLDSGGN